MSSRHTHIPSPEQTQRTSREQARLECAAHACKNADRAERDAQHAEERHVPPELALVPQFAQSLVRLVGRRAAILAGRRECSLGSVFDPGHHIYLQLHDGGSVEAMIWVALGKGVISSAACELLSDLDKTRSYIHCD